MKKNCVFVLIFSLCLSGCINFGHKGDGVGSKGEIVADPQDDMAMEQNGHLKFKGVPIDGKLEEFVARMKRKGFGYVESEDGVAILQGDFADFKDCMVYVSTLDNKDLVSRISVAFPEREQWELLYGDYRHLKELLIEKYGKPSSCIEKYKNYGSGHDSDVSRMLEVKFDESKYETRFTCDNGEVMLRIVHDDDSSCFVILVYKDKVNCDLIREHAKNDL
ncbi:MAG: hypothetical protein J6K19_10660 [Prevotella sp.]|nr:hypothetical protein [Prevotella sp.]